MYFIVIEAALIPTFERINAVAYMSVQSPYYLKFVLKKPSLSYVKNIYVLVFDKTVWLVLAIILVIFAFAAFLILNIEAKTNKVCIFVEILKHTL